MDHIPQATLIQFPLVLTAVGGNALGSQSQCVEGLTQTAVDVSEKRQTCSLQSTAS